MSQRTDELETLARGLAMQSTEMTMTLTLGLGVVVLALSAGGTAAGFAAVLAALVCAEAVMRDRTSHIRTLLHRTAVAHGPAGLDTILAAPAASTTALEAQISAL